MKKPILIVGAGIAGLTLAYQLEKRNIAYLLIDSGENHSSRIAAGIINPVVFRRMALSWRVADFLPFAKNFYREVEQLLNTQFFYPIAIRRSFAHEQEVDLWKSKLNETSHETFLSELEVKEQANYLYQTFGTGVVNESYRIDTKVLLENWHNKLLQSEKLFLENFDYSKLDVENCTYSGENRKIEFDKVVFCEGYQGIFNPFFNYLPLQATKGELLTVKNDQLSENECLNYKCFVLPIGNNTFKVGATYEWNAPNITTSEKAKDELSGHLSKLVNLPFEIVHQEAGVRPTVLDRRPLLGEHPSHKNLFIYNGLGAKGYLISPKLAEEFVAYLVGETVLDKEVNILRYT